MKQKIKEIYEEMYSILFEEFSDYEEAWDCLIEFLIFSNDPKFLFIVNHKFEWLFQNSKLADRLMKVYDLQLLQSDKHDYLGDLLIKYKNELGFDYDPNSVTPSDEIVESLVKKNIKPTDKQIRILDLGTSTGRFLLKISEIVPNAVIFAIDKDIRLLRIAFANCAIHNIQANLLCADYLIHDFDHSTEDGKHNWQYVNKWYPCWDKLRITNTNQRKFCGHDIKLYEPNCVTAEQ